MTVTARSDDGAEKKFEATVRLDTPNEVTYFRNGGILQTVLRKLEGVGAAGAAGGRGVRATLTAPARR